MSGNARTALSGATALVLLAGIGACAETAFNPSFPDNRADVLRTIATKARPPQPGPLNETGKPLIYIVTANPSKIVAFSLAEKSVLWQVNAKISSRVVAGRTRLFHRSGDNEVVGRRVSDGSVVWRAPLFGDDAEERLLGMTTDGDDLYVATEAVKAARGSTASRLAAFDGANGSQRWVRSSTGRIGVPAAQSGHVFVPLRTQSVAVLNAQTGDEVGRARSKEETLLWVRSTPAGAVFGGNSGVYAFDGRAASGTRKGSTFVSAALPTSIRPVYWWNGYNAALAQYTAYDRNRLLWQVTEAGAAPGGSSFGFRDGQVIVHNYRFVFAFKEDRQGKMKLGWAYSYPRYDAVASEYTGRAVVLVTEHGNVVVLDPERGLPVFETVLKLEVVGATFDANAYAAPGEGKGTTDLRRTLKEVIWDPDRRFGAVKLFAVEQLGQIEGKEISEDLVNIVTREGIDRVVYDRAGEILVSRHDKAAIPLYLRTLKSHYNFVKATRASAVDVMAAALGDLKAPDAVQPLLRHLADHETPLPALSAVVKALVAIGDKGLLEPFRDFLLTYRCDPTFGNEAAQGVLNLIAEALLEMGGEEERQLLSFVANDVHTVAPLRAYVDKLMVKRDKAKAEQPRPDKSSPKRQKKR